eukprot:NODE_65_length_25825_cov_1.353844.p15 type:complete len:175 gc:universal NODE_65_length_25825_cov_1.353844:5650-5126(-)
MYFMNEYPMQSQNNSKKRRRLNSEETKILQAVFERNPKPDAMLRAALADRLGMTARNIQIWFQNKRAKTKKVKKDGSDDELASPTAGNDFSQVFSHQEVSPTEDSIVKSKKLLPKMYYVEPLYSQSQQVEFNSTPFAPINLPISDSLAEQSLDIFGEVSTNDFDFLNFLEECEM